MPTCVSCGIKFDTDNLRRLTCSETCRKAWKKQQDKDYRRRVRLADPDINRRRYREKLAALGASPNKLSAHIAAREAHRKTTIARRDSDEKRRQEYIDREQLRNELRTDYRAQRKSMRVRAGSIISGSSTHDDIQNPGRASG